MFFGKSRFHMRLRQHILLQVCLWHTFFLFGMGYIRIQRGFQAGLQRLGLAPVAEPAAMGAQVVIRKVIQLGTHGIDQAAGFLLVGEVPAYKAEAVLLDEGAPGIALHDVNAAVPRGITDAELRDENRNAVGNGVQQTGTHLLAMGCGIKVHGVHDISGQNG